MANINDESVNNSSDGPKDSGLDKSFVGKFVSNIISTTPFSKWFTKETTKNPGEVRRREDTDDDDFSCLLQPVKRAKTSHTEQNYQSINLFESPVTVHNDTSNNNVSTTEHVFLDPKPGPSGFKSKNMLEKHSTPVSISTPFVNNENDSDYSEQLEIKSTSIVSSPQHKYQISDDNSDRLNDSEQLTKTIPKARSLFTPSTDSNENRSLFKDRNFRAKTSLSSRRPNFNASTFGSSSFVDRTLSTKRILSSPFYNGNTIYGGAAALEKRFCKSSDSLMSRTSRPNSIQVSPVNKIQQTGDIILSTTARRILNTIKQYNTPISDAKKIPITPRREGILSKYVGATPYTIPDRKGPPNKELQIPSTPELLRRKQRERLQNSTLAVRQLATTSKLALNQEEYTLPAQKKGSKPNHQNKMKTSFSVPARQKTQHIETVEEVKLPKVSLPITTLPKFDLVMMPTGLTSTSQQPLEANKSKEDAQIAKLETKPISTTKETEKKIVNEDIVNNYTFSKPLVKSEHTKTLKAINCYTFSEPINKMLIKTNNFNMFEKQQTKPKSNGENNIKPASKLVSDKVIDVLGKKPLKPQWECSTCLVKNDNNNTSCMACKESRPVDKSKGGFGDKFKITSDKWECSTCMIRNNKSDQTCVACSTPNSNAEKTVVGFGGKFKPLSNTWECSSCLVYNDSNLDKCQACTTSKTTKQSLEKNTSNSFSIQFKPASDTWECSTCMIRNKNDLQKCAACDTYRKSTTVCETTLLPSVTNTFGDKFKQKADTWECTTCMIRNKLELLKCAACETPKPTSESTGLIGYSGNKFNFGIQPSEWECKTCLIKNKNDLMKCAACESLRPSPSNTEKNKGFGEVFKIKGDEWECTSCLVRNKANVNTCVCCGVVKLSNDKPLINLAEEKKPVNSFNFGIDNSSQFKFGIPPSNEIKKQDSNTNTNSNAVAANVFPTPSSSVATSSSYTFGIKTQEKNDAVSTAQPHSVLTNAVLNPVEKPSLPLQQDVPIISGFNTQETSRGVNKVESTVKKSEAELAFQIKPIAVNGEAEKNLFSFGKPSESNVANTTENSIQSFKLLSKPSSTISGNMPIAPFTFNAKTPEVPSSLSFSKPTEPSQSDAFKFYSKPNDTSTTPAMFKSTPSTFNFEVKPQPPTSISETSLYKFGTSTSSTSVKRSFGDNSNNVNGFGSSSTKQSLFGNSQGFGSNEKINFTFGANVANDSSATIPKPQLPFAQQLNKSNNNNDTTTANAVFSFGSANNAATPSSGGFNFSQTVVPNTGFNFSGNNGNSETLTPSFNAQSSNANMFGGSVAAKNGTFNFGSNVHNNNQKAIFSFGASQTATHPPNQASFNFGSTAPPTVAGPSTAFNFTGGPPSFNFADGNASTVAPQRKIRKAIRRTPR